MRPLSLRSDDGFTLIEVMVYTGLLGLLLAAIFAFLTTSQFTVERQAARSETNNQIRQAAESIDREIRSGDLLYDPCAAQATPTPPSTPAPTCPPSAQESYTPGGIVSGYSLRVFSETNVPSRGQKRCVQYRIYKPAGDPNWELQRRDWDPDWNDASNQTQVSGWRILATGIQNYPGAAAPNNIAAFSRPSVNLVKLVFLANTRRNSTGPISGSVATVRVELSVSGRNSTIVADLQQCGPVPPDPSQSTSDGRRVPPY